MRSQYCSSTITRSFVPGLRAVIDARSDVTVVGEAATGEEAVTLTDHLRPDVVPVRPTAGRRNGRSGDDDRATLP